MPVMRCVASYAFMTLRLGAEIVSATKGGWGFADVTCHHDKLVDLVWQCPFTREIKWLLGEAEALKGSTVVTCQWTKRSSTVKDVAQCAYYSPDKTWRQ
jgi:hypothetical protein